MSSGPYAPAAEGGTGYFLPTPYETSASAPQPSPNAHGLLELPSIQDPKSQADAEAGAMGPRAAQVDDSSADWCEYCFAASSTRCACCLTCRCCAGPCRAPCQRLCSRRCVSATSTLILLLLLAYLGYVIYAAVELAKMRDLEITQEALTLNSTCSTSMPLYMRAAVKNPSRFGVELRNMIFVVSVPGAARSAIRLELQPAFRGHGARMPGGDSVLEVASAVRVENTAELGALLSPLIAGRSDVPVSVDYSFDVSTSAFLVPVSMTVSGTKTVLLNETPKPGDPRAARTEAPNGGVAQNATRIGAVALRRAVGPVIPTSAPALGNYSEGLAAQVSYVFVPEIETHIEVPKLYVRIRQSGVPILLSTVEAFVYAKESVANVTIDMHQLNASAMARVQQIVSWIGSNTTFEVELTAAPDAEIADAAEACVLRQALNAMPPAILQIVPQPSSPEEDARLQGAALASTDSSSSNKRVSVQQVRPVSLLRPRNGSLSARVLANYSLQLAYQVEASMPIIELEVASRAQPVAALRLEASNLSSSAPSLRANVSLALLDELAVADRLLTYTSADALELQVRGRLGVNMISDILHGYVLNLSSADSSATSQPPPPQGSNTTNASAMTIVETDYDANSHFLRINVSLSSAPYDLVIPRVHTAVSRAFLNGSLLSALSISLDAFNLTNQSASQGPLTATLRVNNTQAPNLGALIDDLFQNRTVRFSWTSTEPPLDGDALLVDVHGDLEWQGFRASSVRHSEGWILQSASAPRQAELQSTAEGQAGLGLGPLRLTSALITSWTRRFDSPGNVLAMNLSLATNAESSVRLVGRLPELSISVLRDASAALSLNLSAISLPGNASSNSQIQLVLATSDERALYDSVQAARNRVRSSVLVVRAAETPSTLARVAASFAVNFTVGGPQTASTRNSTLSAGRGDVSWEPMTVAVTDNATSAQAAFDMRLPLPPLDIEVSGGANLSLTFVPPNATQLVLITLNMSALRLCSGSCSANRQFNLVVRSDQADGGTALATFINRTLGSNESAPVRLAGSFGIAPVLIEFDLATAKNLSQPLDETAGVDERVRDPSQNGLNGIEFLGGASIGSPIVLPCVAPSAVCPVQSDRLRATPLLLGINITFNNPFPWPLNFSTPRVDAQVRCCPHSPLVNVSLLAWAYSSTTPFQMPQLSISWLDLPLLQDAARLIDAAEEDVAFRASGRTGGGVNLLSAMFSAYEQLLLVPKRNQTAAPPPVSSSEPLVKYWLTGTTDNSATVALAFTIDNPFSFEWHFRNLRIGAVYSGVEFASVTASRPVRVGREDWELSLSVFGEPQVSAQCLNASIPNKRFCVANQLVSRLINRDFHREGTPLGVNASFINGLGVRIPIEVDLILFEEDGHVRPASEDEAENDLIVDNGLDGLDSIANSVVNFLNFQVSLVYFIDINNTKNISFALTDLRLDLYQNDYDGVGNYWYIPGTPRAANTEFLLTSNLALSNPSGFTFSPSQTRRVEVGFLISYGSVPEVATRVYDDAGVKGRLCSHVRNAQFTVRLQHASDTPLLFTQGFTFNNLSMKGGPIACDQNAGCNPRMRADFNFSGTFAGSESQFALVGDARFQSGVLELTNGADDRSAAYLVARVNVTRRWEARFRFRMVKSCFFCAQGDGIVFIVHNAPAGTAALGSACSTTEVCHGFKGIPNSLGVVFDSISINELSVNLNGSSTKLSSTDTPPEYDDEQLHTAVVHYNAPLSRLYVSVDGSLGVAAAIDLRSIGLGPDGLAYVGFTASTGTAAQSDQTIDSFSWAYVDTELNNTVISEQGRSAGRAGQNFTVTVEARDSCTLPRTDGGDNWALSLVARSGNATVNATSISDLGNGRYKATFFAPAAGEFDIVGSLPAQSARNRTLGQVLIAA